MRPEPENDSRSWEELLVAVAEHKEHAAFARLFAHFAPRLKAYAMRGGALPSAAEDIAQETMAAAWRKAHLYDPAKANAGTWLFAISRNLRIDRIRRERRPEPDPNDPAFTPEPEVAPDLAVSKHQSAEAVKAALKDLPEVQREAVLLSFYEEEPHAAIATRLGLPLGTVKSRIRLALKRLGDALDPNAHGAKE